MKSLTELNTALSAVQTKIVKAQAAIETQDASVAEANEWLKAQGTDPGQIDATIMLLEDEIKDEEQGILDEAQELSTFFDNVLEVVK